MSPRLPLAAASFAAAVLLMVATTSAVAATAGRYLKEADAWFAGDEARRIGSNILSHQSELGGWRKNSDTTSKPYVGDRAKIQPTFDNGATTDELRFLARLFHATREERYAESFRKGHDYILKAQYPTGGWPQYFPPPANSYHRHITFNDSSMVRLMEFLRESWTSERYAFLDAPRKQAARTAFDLGIQCILKCQIRTDGRLRGWCAQHDEIDYQPRKGRSYELISLSGAESVGITRLLMSLDRPSPDVVLAVDAAVAWFESAKLTGIRIEVKSDPESPKGTNKVVVEDATAPPLWARFYDIASNRPIFMDRDGVPKPRLADIGYERRNGYGWYGNWAQTLIDKEYPAWKRKWGESTGR